MIRVRLFIAAATAAFAARAAEPLAKFTYAPTPGIGKEAGVMRRDPSDVIQVRDTFYVWYTKGKVAHGYDATIWYATSKDGHAWTEQGESLARGPEGSWDEQSVFTPNILVAENRYWLFYTAVPKPFTNFGNRGTKTAFGLASSASPDGPWEKLAANPIMKPSDDPAAFDSFRIDDACLIVRDGKYWLFYKGRQWDNTPADTKLGIAIADKPQGPYVRHEGNPVVKGGHEVLVWPHGTGVCALINIGPAGIAKSLQRAPDGRTFTKVASLTSVPGAPGAYRPEAFTDSGHGAMIEWGISMSNGEKGSLPFLQRYECQWPKIP